MIGCFRFLKYENLCTPFVVGPWGEKEVRPLSPRRNSTSQCCYDSIELTPPRGKPR